METAPFDQYSPEQTACFKAMADGIRRDGYCVVEQALSKELIQALHQECINLYDSDFQAAGIGRGDDKQNDSQIRTDKIHWISGSTEAGRCWLSWATALQQYLNRELMLGLFSFESHFSHYATGDYYKRHKDAFRGRTNRILSVVAYLNPTWEKHHGGELVLYQDDDDQEGRVIEPHMGSLVVFLSEHFPHEVLTSQSD